MTHQFTRRSRKFGASLVAMLMATSLLVALPAPADAATLGRCHKSTAYSGPPTPPGYVKESYSHEWLHPTRYVAYDKPEVYYVYRETVYVYIYPVVVGNRIINGKWSKSTRTKYRHCSSNHYVF